MDPVDFAQVQCPYCGELIDLEVDASAGPQCYVEDCSVCCRPIEVTLQIDGANWQLDLKRDDE